MNTSELEILLEKRYPAGPWAYLTQVRSSTGYSNTVRTADAIAMSLWPSRGLDLYGFEMKVSRSDWLHELKHPAKADEIASFCDYWYLVCGDDKIIKDGELPATWGLLVASDKGLREVVKPDRLTTGKPITKEFLAALLRRAADGMIPKVDLNVRIASIRKEIEESAKEHAEYELERYKKSWEDMKAGVKAFETAAGISISSRYGAADYGAAMRAVVCSKTRAQYLADLKSQLSYAADDLDKLKQRVADIENVKEENETEKKG